MKRLILSLLIIVALFIVLSVGFISCVVIGNIRGKKRYAKYRETGNARESIRTPDERFSNLPGYDFEPHYIEIDGLRMHYLDEGPRDADPVLLMHGEPSWCYLYRKMIGPIVNAGHRVIAPDLIGFGRSDKLIDKRDHSYQMHVDMITTFIKELDLKNITLFCQDWGGLIGLRVAAENEERYARIIAANTALPGRPPPPAGGGEWDQPLLPARSGMGFLVWLLYSQLAPGFTAGGVVQFGTVTELPPEIVAAYDAPFPNKRYLAAARIFPALVPSQMVENTRAWEVYGRWEKPFLTAFSDSDPILGGGDKIFQLVIPGTKGQPHTTTIGASHFLQEDKGEELADLVVKFIARTQAKK